MGKNLVIYLFVFVLASTSFCCYSQSEKPVSVAGNQKELITEAGTDSLCVPTENRLSEWVLHYIDNHSSDIPHPSFWDHAKEYFRHLMTGLFESVFPASWFDFIHSVIEIVFDAPILIILLLFSITFMGNVIVVTAMLAVVSYVKQGRERYKERMNRRYEEILTNYLFYDLSQEAVLEKLNKKRSSLSRNVLIDIFLNYKRNLSGEFRDRILDLYAKMELYKNSEKKIRSFYTYKRVMGIRELANMYPSGAKQIIATYVRDKNRKVRSEAQIAYAYLDEDTSFGFLDDLDQRLSTWVQLNILNYVKMHEREVPLFHRWIDSPNQDVQNFSIRMINYFQQSESAGYLIRKLDYPKEETRMFVYQAIRYLRLFDGKEPVKKKYESESKQNKIEILKIIRDLGDENDFSFLADILKGDDVSLKIQACKAFYMIGDSGKAFLKEYSESEDLDLKRYIQHVKDQRN
ncbi:HEAT repeat domain-containing protein [Mangrovibacterium sp.]|uniref:HEAT repeat domain-containing protein n=1 Tax=Mangrovibacterium sp. TaxID=1961364 RepID=UPI0035622278